MKTKISSILLLIISINSLAKERAPKPTNRFSFSAGIGPSYSIWNDKLLKFEGTDTVAFIGLTTLQKKKPIGINLFGEFSCIFRRNFYLTVGLDYNQFSRKFSNLHEDFFISPYYSNEISFSFGGRLIDRNFTIQSTINKKFIIKKHSIHIGTGLYFINIIEPFIEIGFQPPPYQTFLGVSENSHWEFGFPFQVCYEYAINNKWSVGLKTQYQYILSTQNSQNIYFSPYFRLNIQKMEKKRKKSDVSSSQ